MGAGNSGRAVARTTRANDAAAATAEPPFSVRLLTAGRQDERNATLASAAYESDRKPDHQCRPGVQGQELE